MTSSARQTMQAGTMPRIEPWLNGVSVFILSTTFLFWDASRAAYVLLSLAALGFLIRYRPQLPRDHRLYAWPIIAFFAATFISVAYDGFSDSGRNWLTSRFLLLLIAIPLVSMFYTSFDPGRNQWTKFVMGCLVMGLLALVDILVLDARRAGGGHNQAIFGFSAAAMTSIVIASYYQFKNTSVGKLVFVVALLMGFCAMLLSGTRSSWIAFIAVVMIAMIFYLDRYSLSKRILVSLALIGCIAAGGLTIPLVKKRVDNMIVLVTPYVKGEEQTRFNSLRYRVEAWKAAWNMGMTDQIFGLGPGNWKKSLRAYVEQRPHLATLERINHAHNQFMHTFFESGFIGLISLLVMLGCHCWIFAKYLHKRYSSEVRSLALAGFLLVVAYIIYSIPGVPFNGKQYLMMYAFSTASIWGCLLGALQQSVVTTESRPG
jgi:O-antigen ligase